MKITTKNKNIYMERNHFGRGRTEGILKIHREKRLTLKRVRVEEERITVDGERKKARRYVFFYAFTRVPCILRFYCALISRKMNTCIKTHP